MFDKVAFKNLLHLYEYYCLVRPYHVCILVDFKMLNSKVELT